ncbi:uncharacterized protein [Branchiostoma lanceolatum]|uniref:uncharacterized protein n=1 Tax=Branchiostoma lanceolatum TaxID=7740 RepID=UPI003455920F
MKVLALLCVIGMALAGPIPKAREDDGSGVETPETVYQDEEKPEGDGDDVIQPEEKSDTESEWEDIWEDLDTDWEIPGWEDDAYDPEQPESEKPISNYPEEEEPEEKDPYYPEQAEVEDQDPNYPDPEESNREDPGLYYPEEPEQGKTEPEYPEQEDLDGRTEDHGGNQAAEQQQQQQGAETMPVREAAQYRQTGDIVAGGSRPGVHPWYQEPAPNYQQYNYDRQMYQYYNAHYYPPSGQNHYGSEGEHFQNPWAYNQHYLSNPDGSWVFNPFYNPEGDYYK